MSIAPPRNPAGTPGSRTIQIDDNHLAALGLTPREREVMRWLTEGKRDGEIAIILGLSPRTVEKHASHILHKLNVETRTAAASECRYAVGLSVVPNPVAKRRTRRAAHAALQRSATDPPKKRKT
jgi:DNA-binding CsgD family transcriptional regulator